MNLHPIRSIIRLMRREKPSRQQTNGHEQRLIQLCSCSISALFETLGTGTNGLSDDEAATRLDEFGANELAHIKRPGFWRDIGHRIASPLVIQLLIIASVSAVVGEAISSIIVGGMIVLSVGLSYILDRRSNLAVDALGKRIQSRAHVIRAGKEEEIKISSIVPGDIVLLQAGSIIPADLRLIAAKDFFVSESTLTGESMPVEKTVAAAAAPTTTALALPNACFLGTSVISGAARGVVINTGGRTLFGGISETITGRRDETSFDKGVRSFTWLMMRFMIVMVMAVFFIVGITKGDWVESLLFGLSVAVGLTPEMLPMIVTVNLAKGALAMAKKKVIVKRLPAIQNFGSIDILCTDKTGTLTQDRVVLEHHVDTVGRGSEEVLNYAYLNSKFQTGLRNLIDKAILEYVDLDAGQCKLVDELPFDFQRRRMSVVVDYEGDNVLICKGAVEEIYDCCTSYQIDDEVYPLIGLIRSDLLEEVERLNRDGFRVLGIAYREFPQSKTEFAIEDEQGLILLGYISFFDPPKESAMDAISQLSTAGVQVKVLTGDNGLVTEKICRDVGLESIRTISGPELAVLTAEEFNRATVERNVFVKLSPSQKEEIILALRRGNAVVGYMGDGINDVPALRAADVGISVDAAADIAKESADIVLLEKSLRVLEEGIIEGRKVFANIVKYIRMGASSNFGNMFSVLGASILLPFLPMKPIQILANNLLYDLSQTGIPTDNVDPELIEKPLRWDISNIKRFMTTIGPVSSLFDYATFALMWFVFGCSSYLDGTLDAVHRASFVRLFQTGWFVESLLTQTLIVHIIRTRRIPFFQSRASVQMSLTTLAVIVAGIWLPYSPIAPMLGLAPLPMHYWIWISGFMIAYTLITHTIKTWFSNRYEGRV